MDINEFDRRADEQRQKSVEQQKKIKEMIEAEDDTKARTRLMLTAELIFGQSEGNQTINHIAMQQHIFRKGFDEHVMGEMAMANKIRGGLYVAAIVFTLLQGVAMYLFSDFKAELQAINRFMEKDRLEHVEFRDKLHLPQDREK